MKIDLLFVKKLNCFLGVDFPARYNSWDRVDPAELFICQIEHKEANPKLKMPAVGFKFKNLNLQKNIILVLGFRGEKLRCSRTLARL